MGEDYATGFNPLPFIPLSLGEACSTEQVLLTLTGEAISKPGLTLCPLFPSPWERPVVQNKYY